jgi:hypothetical protein
MANKKNILLVETFQGTLLIMLLHTWIRIEVNLFPYFFPNKKVTETATTGGTR